MALSISSVRPLPNPGPLPESMRLKAAALQVRDWTGTAPAASDIARKVNLGGEGPGADRFSYQALILKSGQVVFQRSGGFAGLTTYSKPQKV